LPWYEVTTHTPNTRTSVAWRAGSRLPTLRRASQRLSLSGRMALSHLQSRASQTNESLSCSKFLLFIRTKCTYYFKCLYLSPITPFKFRC